MGLCIDGMWMPKEGRITIQIGADGAVYTVSSCKITAEKYEEKYSAIEVTEPHGDLIDADKLKETLDYYIREAGWSDEINKALSWMKDEFIDSEQAIIPASEEE